MIKELLFKHEMLLVESDLRCICALGACTKYGIVIRYARFQI